MEHKVCREAFDVAFDCLNQKPWFDFALDSVLQFRLGDFQIVAQSQVQPRLCIRPEIARQPQCGTLRQADGTTSHSTKLLENISQVAGYQGERVLVNQLLSKPPQAIAERAARFDATVVFIQRVLVFFQPLIALRLPDGLDQSLLRFGVEDNTAHCFSLTFVIRIIYAHRVLTSKPANRCAAWQSIVCGENELQQILHSPPAENRGFATRLIFLPAVNQRGGWGI